MHERAAYSLSSIDSLKANKETLKGIEISPFFKYNFIWFLHKNLTILISKASYYLAVL